MNALGKTTPCVSDCTAEVHRIDIIEDVRKHGMSLENCVHCRTCEIVCPEVNLRVKPTAQGSGPDFLGL
jgi:electron-transferring-flavoprotein dehydrogenase